MNAAEDPNAYAQSEDIISIYLDQFWTLFIILLTFNNSLFIVIRLTRFLLSIIENKIDLLLATPSLGQL